MKNEKSKQYYNTEKQKDKKTEDGYYKDLLISLIEKLNETQIKNLYYIGLGMKNE